ncbi:Trypanosome variant surface glycoprotein C-terminal domain containing protein [Trypanosoma brucei equiperdum]|uniref:Trypanosome variant surface glycoprotein C-terminal domain containing protein n=1 Tax=Trypanosoma brucei equiperdum TaxID=630700 RepID=A0A3L6L940_9TRYP|nr:Trypanosome variant surface glycoprotein C-terminal domain containing protein [Trypanosoma brucei equiperdum]RHW72016.1 Trypanosome variant surface glycoprotein C-terminal domain containing protein [Trypanosoma brucei equiperdum]RHW72038.1 Trypanosome variant surface glycoprotein C-terminal domain containing protein [Trypanosoma brucei equiperdum]RHW72081.1 Trypanosome variant surface glycoprotein C-terminal domain containing protein [Trypanosoma brucei equiperdum]
MCICGTDSSNADQCNSDAINYKWNNANDDSVATDIKSRCTKPTSCRYTAATLHRLIATVTARIRYDKKADNSIVAYLGKTNSGTPGTCDGNNGQSCVIYKFDTSKRGANTAGFDIPWLKHLVLAADALEEAEKAAQQANKLSEQINDLQTTCEEAYKAKRYNRDTTQTANPDGAASAAEKTRQKTQCPRKNTTEEECPEAHCDYEAKTQECKAKPGAENTAAGTGQQAGAAAAAGCAKHGTDKTACENDKTDDKQNCAWRKGKDGEDDKETEKCRNGSFLVTKKFVLRMTAFMSLTVL